MEANQPHIQIRNHQKKHPLQLELLLSQSQKLPGELSSYWLSNLKWVDISFIEAQESGRIHHEFFRDPAPTDVMTFPADDGGDILICPEIAEKQRHLERLSLHKELMTYIIHGMLHLCGFDDQTDEGFETMRKMQHEICSKIL